MESFPPWWRVMPWSLTGDHHNDLVSVHPGQEPPRPGENVPGDLRGQSSVRRWAQPGTDRKAAICQGRCQGDASEIPNHLRDQPLHREWPRNRWVQHSCWGERIACLVADLVVCLPVWFFFVFLHSRSCFFQFIIVQGTCFWKTYFLPEDMSSSLFIRLSIQYHYFIFYSRFHLARIKY